MEKITTTGEKIRIARTKAGLSQGELANRLDVTQSLIGQYERGVRNPKPSTIQRIADALGIPFTELLPVDAIKQLPPVQLGTNLAEVGTRAVIGYPIDADALMEKVAEEYGERARDTLYRIIRYMPPVTPKQRTEALKAEIRRMKRSFTTCINSDYYTGYMSALSAVEGYIAKMEEGAE